MKQASTGLIEFVLVLIFLTMMNQCTTQTRIAQELQYIRMELEKGIK